MSYPVDVFVDLCNQTDGRDKIYKALAGLTKMMGDSPNPEAKKFAALSKAIGNGRSLMRMGKWVNNAQKVSSLAPKVIKTVDPKDLVDIFRIVCDAGYVVYDNIQYLASYGIINTDAKAKAFTSKKWQFFSFFAACCLDAYACILAIMAKDKKKLQASIINLIKNMCDCLSALSAVGWAKAYGYNPGATANGAFGLIAGSIATYANTSKVVEKVNKKMIVDKKK